MTIDKITSAVVKTDPVRITIGGQSAIDTAFLDQLTEFDQVLVDGFRCLPHEGWIVIAVQKCDIGE